MTCCQMLDFLGVFVVQAEDGMRERVRSRGLGDVYRIQPPHRDHGQPHPGAEIQRVRAQPDRSDQPQPSADPVSYTHLTLPTSDLV